MYKKVIAIVAFIAVLAVAYCNRATAYKTGEYIDNERGVKVCVYNAYGKTYYSAVGTYNLCPLTIEVCTRY